MQFIFEGKSKFSGRAEFGLESCQMLPNSENIRLRKFTFLFAP